MRRSSSSTSIGTGVDAGQTTFRVRHMYAKWGPFLAGQTNTLLMDGDIFPNVIDYWGPPGMVFVAQSADPLDFPRTATAGWRRSRSSIPATISIRARSV